MSCRALQVLRSLIWWRLLQMLTSLVALWLRWLLHGPREPGVVDVVADQRTTGEEERKESDVIESEGTAESDALRRDLVVPSNWIDVSGDNANLRLCRIVYQQAGSSPPLVVARSLVVDSSVISNMAGTYIFMHGHQLDPSLVPNWLLFHPH